MTEPGGLLGTLLARLRDAPHLAIPGALAYARGWYYKIVFPLLGKRFRAGRFFRVYGPLYLAGRGRVEFGDDVLIISNAIKPVYIRTLSPDAVIRLGDHAGLNGTSIQCIESVAIGDWSNLADAYITDTAAHTLDVDRRQRPAEAAPHAPVSIGRNVWVSVQVVITHGVSIGENAVIGACSLVRGDVPANRFYAGNPLREISHIPGVPERD